MIPRFALMMNDEYKKCLAERVRILIYHSQFIIHHFSLPPQRHFMAEDEGFEPPWGCPQTVFKFFPPNGF